MKLKNILIIFILSVPAFLFAQSDKDIWGEIEEQYAEEIFSLEYIDDFSPKKQREIFNKIQYLIGVLQRRQETKKKLLISLCEKQIDFFPDERKPYIDMANYYYRCDDMKSAFEFAGDSLKKKNHLYRGDVNKSKVLIYTIMGQYHLENNEYQKAYDSLKEIMWTSTTNSQPFFLMGNTCFKLGKFQESMNVYTVGFTTDPDDAYPIDYYFYSVVLSKFDNLDKSEQFLEAGITMYPNSDGLRFELGNVLVKKQRLIDAYSEYHAENIIFRENGRFYEQVQVATDMLEKIIPSQNNNRDIKLLWHITNWNKFILEKKYDDALIEIETILKGKKSPRWLFDIFLQQTYVLLKRYDDALDVLEQIRIQMPGFSHTYVTIGEIYLKMNEPELALGNFSKANKLDPDNWKVKSAWDKIMSTEQQPKEND